MIFASDELMVVASLETICYSLPEDISDKHSDIRTFMVAELLVITIRKCLFVPASYFSVEVSFFQGPCPTEMNAIICHLAELCNGCGTAFTVNHQIKGCGCVA